MKTLNLLIAKNLAGPQIKRYRILAGFTQNDLTLKLELIGIYINRASISKIENQLRIVTDYELIAIANILNVNVNELLKNKALSQ